MLSFQKNITLAPYTSFKIGGPADYFFIAQTEADLISAVNLAKEQNLPVLILGGGSNMLISDQGFRGVVIKVDSKNYKLPAFASSYGEAKQTKNHQIQADAGVLLAALVQAAGQSNLTGLEWAIGIPGTLGGAIYGNAGAFGQQMADAISAVRVYDQGAIKDYRLIGDEALAVVGVARESARLQSGDMIVRVKREAVFAYRDSIFKQASATQKPIILSAVLQLKTGDKTQIQEQLKNNSLYRRERQPHEPSAGSVFKNVQFDKLPENLQTTIPTEKIKAGKVAAAYFIELAGLKGRQIGQAQVSLKHANFIVNLDGAKAQDVLDLVNLVKQETQAKFGIILESEVQLIGFSHPERSEAE